MPSHQEHAASFDEAAAEYARSRPGYPAQSIAWLLEGIDGAIVDLGAGTGLLTRDLVPLATSIVAVEPSDNMRAILADSLPSVTALRGTGESIPLGDSSTDAVVSAQAWHWVDVDLASAEVARVLRPGGRLGLIWNLRDDSIPWVAQLGDVLGGSAAAGWSERIREGSPAIGKEFGTVECHTFSWVQRLTVDGLVDLAASRSYVITVPESERLPLLDSVRAFGREVADVKGTIALPYRTYSFRAGLS